jgi:hypothetical protein
MKIYRSTDASAPVLDGTTASAAINVLKACLVDGFGALAAAGWSLQYSGTNKAVLRAGPSAAARASLRILDDGSHAQGFREASWRVYMSMSDVDTGTDPTPTVAQEANGLQLARSSTLDATARPWIVLADPKTVIFLTKPVAGNDNWWVHYAGEILTVTPGDAWHACCIGNTVGTAVGTSNHGFMQLKVPHYDFATAGSLGYIARLHTGTGAAIGLARTAATGFIRQNTYCLGHLPAVNPADGAVLQTEILCLTDTSVNARRGTLRGIRIPLHDRAGWGNNTTFTGDGDLAGRDFEMIHVQSNAGTGMFAIEISDTAE